MEVHDEKKAWLVLERLVLRRREAGQTIQAEAPELQSNRIFTKKKIIDINQWWLQEQKIEYKIHYDN